MRSCYPINPSLVRNHKKPAGKGYIKYVYHLFTLFHVLLYTTFVQVPMAHVRQSLGFLPALAFGTLRKKRSVWFRELVENVYIKGRTAKEVIQELEFPIKNLSLIHI